MSEVVEWEEPRRDRRGAVSTRYRRIADELRRHPGQWAVIFEGASDSARTAAYQCRRGMRRGFDPIKDFEFECRTTNGAGKVYARYIGEKPP